MEELWKPIQQFEDRYMVSNLGRLARIRAGRFHKYLSTQLQQAGYPQVTLRKNGQKFCFRVHRLVALAFVSNSTQRETVNHIDGNKTNNVASNLEWLSCGENDAHARRIGLTKPARGERVHTAKLTESDVRAIRRSLADGARRREVALAYGVRRQSINDIVNGKSWGHVH